MASKTGGGRLTVAMAVMKSCVTSDTRASVWMMKSSKTISTAELSTTCVENIGRKQRGSMGETPTETLVRADHSQPSKGLPNVEIAG